MSLHLAASIGSEPEHDDPSGIVETQTAFDHDWTMSLHDEQADCLRRTIEWARRLRDKLGPIQRAHGDRVHFRPCSTGVAMIGLLPKRPQRGKGGMTNLDRLAVDFESLFASHCENVDQGRVTGEKALQSLLIGEAYKHDRKLTPINDASNQTAVPVELWFMTDEIAMPVEEGKKAVCDLLALRRDGGRSTPVLLELKDDRMLTRLVEQVEGYSTLMNEHAELFMELYGALLGERVRFDGSTESWIVWPSAGREVDPREEELAARGIRVVSYTLSEDGQYTFRIRSAPTNGSPR